MIKKTLDPNPDFYEIVQETPSEIRRTDSVFSASFEKTSFGNIELEINAEKDGTATLILGEMYDPFYNRIERHPLQNVRSVTLSFPVTKGRHRYMPEIPSGNGFLKSPTGFEIMPFRFCELSCTCPVLDCTFTRNSVFGKICMADAGFHCSNAMLEKVWNFCQYTLRATTLFGCFIDGERERLPYEGDSYVTALSYYAVSSRTDVVRRTIDYLIDNPTWPTEYMLLMPVMVRDYVLYSGDTKSLKGWFEALKNKLLIPFCFDGVLIDVRRAHETWNDKEIMKMTGLTEHFAHWMRDMVDWPHYERDRYDFGDFISNPEIRNLKGSAGLGIELAPPNFVPNAVQAASCHAMMELCIMLGKMEESRFYADREEKIKTELRRTMRSAEKPCLFVDSPGSWHTACLTDTFALWAHIAEPENIAAVAGHLAYKGMACSSYASTFLLHSLFENGYAADALKLMADETGFRSWSAMMQQGATITKETWTNDADKGIDWSHAWSASPLHVIPRCLFGLRPTEPGFLRFTVNPQLMFLEYASLIQPTIHGQIRISIHRIKCEKAEMSLQIPANTIADVTFGTKHVTLTEGLHTVSGFLPVE